MAVGPNRPEKFLRTKPIKKCAETHLIPCSGIETVECCKIVPCTYCLELEDYDGIQYGTATLNKADGTWSGSVGGVAFLAWWEPNQYSGECEFVVEFGGEEVYRASCYDGVSCRDASGEAGVSIGYDAYTLRWIKKLPRPLPYVVPEGECRTWFCGTCECTCECLCVTITDSYGDVLATGEICDTAYPCDGPVWAGTVANPEAGTSYEFSLSLERDPYGECVVTGSIGGDDVGQISVSGCSAISFEFTNVAGVVFGVRCKVCDCTESNLCCGGRNLSGPLNLNVLNTLTTCSSPQGVFSIPVDGSPAGPFSVLVPVPDGGEDICVAVDFTFRFFCDPGGPVYQLEMKFDYLGTTYPTTGWYSQFKVSEDCGPPYIGLWEQRGDGAFWNGVLSFLVEE